MSGEGALDDLMNMWFDFGTNTIAVQDDFSWWDTQNERFGA